MALFPAFGGASNTKVESSRKDLEWLSNQSFHTDDALTLHQRVVEKASTEAQGLSETRDQKHQKEEHGCDSDEYIRSKRKKKKEKKKKRKKQKKRTGGSSESSSSESDTVYPSDLLKKAESAERQESQVQPGDSFAWLDDLQGSTEKLFCIDRRADPANWEYKSLYRGDIARYKRKGSSSLGLDSKTQAVSWNDSGPEKKRVDRKPERYFSSSFRQVLRSDGQPALPALTEPLTNTPFIPLPAYPEDQNPAAQQPSSWVNPLGVYDSSTTLWLQGKGQAEVKGQQQRGEEPAGVGGGPLMARVEEFNRKLRENPTETHTWLEFIRFQDELAAHSGTFSGAQDSDAERRRGSVRALLEKKVAIAERAVEANPSCVEVKLERLRLCKELWEPATLLKEWKKLVFLHPNSAPLWRHYLLFTQSHFSTFSVSKVNAVYGKCLSTLSSVLDGSMVSHPPLPGTEEDMLAIFLQQCHFLRQAGHSEKAVCLFQALLDFTFYKPDSVKELPTRQQVEFFEPFWDSGEPRVGEHGARGWKAWMHQQERGGWVVPPEAEDDEDEDEEDSEIKDKSWPKWKIWLDVESSREAKHWLPWRPDKAKGQSEEDCEDPDRQVLFDDIGSSMIRIRSPALQLRFILSFLQFLGLPGPVGTTRSPSHSLILDDLSLLAEGPDPERPLTSYDSLKTGVCSVGHMTFLLDPRRQPGLCKSGEEFVRNVLEQIMPLVSVQDRAALSLCWLQYEKLKVLRCVCSRNKKRLKAQGKRSKRLAKRLLKEPENRGSLALWREYAHLEWLLGNLEEARKVFDTALGLGISRGLADPDLCDLCLLYAQLEVEDAWRVGAQNSGTPPTSSSAVHVLTKLAEGTGYAPFSGQINPVTILKARKTYEQTLMASLPGQEDAVSHGGSKKLRRVAALVGCFGLFQYLTMGIDAADAVYSQARDRLAERSAMEGSSDSETPSECEAVTVQHLALLKHHVSTNVCPLSRLRLALTSSLTRLPSSAPLWQLYIQVESRYHSAGRSRRFFHSVAKDNRSVIPHLFAITAEQRRKRLLDSVQRSGLPGEVLPTLPENGLSNRIRSLFEVATATETGAHCPLLWRMYLNFMVSDGNAERGRGIFYKALQDVPWVKGLYMDAVQLFPEHIQEFLDLLTEKELRLRAPMEEVDILLED
ncbi:protein NRDE2 homolog [Chanos chanos]|uniref:Protein NRDE2 homolog n=1 Tax=Chanos chanos TaxID=29144 RepID=A0A6J2VD61_CHACN|nr:protein NRDE2 homolog [Chanos chanos]